MYFGIHVIVINIFAGEMKAKFFLILISVALTAGCSQDNYAEAFLSGDNVKSSSSSNSDKSNQPVISTKRQISKPRSDGYMRIIGDLRWDELTSNPEWRERFSCLGNGSYNSVVRNTPYSHGATSDFYVDDRFQGVFTNEIKENREPGADLSYNKFVLVESPYGAYAKKLNVDCNYTVGGIKMNPDIVQFRENTRTPSGFMTSIVGFAIPDSSQWRAFTAAIEGKYEYNGIKYCSRYTCWQGLFATPTPYTISILDNVRTDSSEF